MSNTQVKLNSCITFMNPALPDYFPFCSFSSINTFPSTMNHLFMANQTSAVRKALGQYSRVLLWAVAKKMGPK